MATTHRFKIDENLPVEIAELLTGAGHDASTVHSQALAGAGDPVLAQTCLGEGRALVTMDLDFADIRTYPPERYAGCWFFGSAGRTSRTSSVCSAA